MDSGIFDTVAIDQRLIGGSHAIPDRSHWRPSYSPDGRIRRHVYTSDKDEQRPRLTANYRKDSHWYMRVEASLPKLLHGSNVAALSDSDVPAAFEKLSDFVSGAWGTASTLGRPTSAASISWTTGQSPKVQSSRS
jgi:hypothetical protein